MMDWEFPIFLGWDVADIISEVGSEVTDWKVGDEVFARPNTTRFGTYAEYTLVDDHLLARLTCLYLMGGSCICSVGRTDRLAGALYTWSTSQR
ncbi:quinone oxidoreductase-like protein [Paenibacillus terrae HPL-003]|uniref:Quinone oxidoreductase-like protein n=1 Tax=Paenibacillus terrae (strain HPL-003) TaxID=985665 RepID=G7W080_PAETH|nr:quinone oxidoreductase-like protein [Paenibacillus terrae HPL-003]